MAKGTREVVNEYIQAIGDGHLHRLEALLHPDAVFGGAIAGELHGAEAYVGAFRGLAPILARNEIRELVVEGDKAFVLYDFVTDTEVGAVLSGELVTVEDGRIRSSVLLFDQRRWPDVMKELREREARPVAATDA